MKGLVGLLVCALFGCGALATTTLGAGSATAGLAFIKHNTTPETVWVANANGTGQREVGPGGDDLLSPNGELVAAFRLAANGPGLLIYHVSGGTVRLAPKLKGVLGITPVAWSPDSRYLAVSIPDSSNPLGAGNAKLEVIDTTTGKVTATVPGIVQGASFAPSGGDRLVFGLTQSPSQDLNPVENLHTLSLGTETTTQATVTYNGRSFNPVWGSRGIVFAEYTRRGPDNTLRGFMLPAYHLKLLNGTHVRSIASPNPSALQTGLIPLAVSADGEHLIADFRGVLTSLAYTVNLATNHYAIVKGRKNGVQPWGISRDGRRLLISYGGLVPPSSRATIATIPFGGGKPTTLVKGGEEPSWNQ